MANPYTYIDVEWANGELLEESKLDQMMECTEYVRHEAAYNMVMSSPTSLLGNAATQIRLAVYINYAKYADSGSYTSSSTDVAQKVVNVDISGLSEGIHNLQLVCEDGAIAKVAMGGKFYRGLEANFLSAWAMIKLVYSGSSDKAQISQASAITHRLTEATW